MVNTCWLTVGTFFLLGATASMYKPGVVTSPADGSSPFAGITVDKSVEFSYAELAAATDDFSLAYKIGGGGFGVVYYAELRGEVSHPISF